MRAIMIIIWFCSCGMIMSQPVLTEGVIKDASSTCGCYDKALNGVEYHFNICLGNKKIGNYRTYQYRQDGLTFYCSESNVSFWFFGQVEVHYQLEAIFKDSELLYSLCVGKKNGRERLRSEIIKNGEEWYVRQDLSEWGKHPPVTSSIIKLYYEVPQIGENAVVESTLTTKKVIGREGNVYLLQANGRRGLTEMMYEGGKLVRVNVDSPILNFSVVSSSGFEDDCNCTTPEIQ